MSRLKSHLMATLSRSRGIRDFCGFSMFRGEREIQDFEVARHIGG
jgi:hypothetical protein